MPSPPSPSGAPLPARGRSMPHAAKGEKLPPLAGVPFAVKNLFDIAGLPTLAGSKINRELPPADARRGADRAAGSGRRHPGRRAQHGRIRLRLHRRERPRRPFAQSARSRPHDRRLVRRLGRRGRRRPGAARARLRHQRLDPGAVVAVRHFRAQADLRAAHPRADISVRGEPRSSRAVRAHARAIWRWPTTPCRVSTPTIRPAPTAPAEPVDAAAWTQASTACASPSPAAISGQARAEALAAVDRVAAALGANRDIEIPEAERARAAAYVITATEGATLHLDRLRTRAQRFRSRRARSADRRRHGAGFAGGESAEIPPLVSRRGLASCSQRSTPSWRRRRRAPRR